MLRFRLQTARAVYPRPPVWRLTSSVTPATPSDSFNPSRRAQKNIRRLKSKRLRLAPQRPGQRRSLNRLNPLGQLTKSDAMQSAGTRVFKRTWRYWRAR